MANENYFDLIISWQVQMIFLLMDRGMNYFDLINFEIISNYAQMTMIKISTFGDTDVTLSNYFAAIKLNFGHSNFCLKQIISVIHDSFRLSITHFLTS